MIRRYRKKPVVIEAIKYDYNNPAEVVDFIEDEIGINANTKQVIISTLEGEMLADDGDYIIKGIKGEFYPCKPDIFELTYEEVQGNG